MPSVGETLALDLLHRGVLILKDDGSVWRVKDRRSGSQDIEPRRVDGLTKNGYRQLAMHSEDDKKTYIAYAHRVIWLHKVGCIPDGIQINHIDMNRGNNAVTNLELVTPSENVHHAYKNGRARPWSKTTFWQGKSRITEETKQLIRDTRKTGKLYKELAEMFNISITQVHRICVKKTP